MEAGTLTVHGSVIHSLGYGMEGGLITVFGNVGGAVGDRMENGAITINGNAGNLVGESMGDGAITITGNVGGNTGKEMTGGVITIGGNCGGLTGDFMKGGSISVDGTIESIGYVSKGRIIHQGSMLIERNGVLTASTNSAEKETSSVNELADTVVSPASAVSNDEMIAVGDAQIQTPDKTFDRILQKIKGFFKHIRE